MTVQSGTHLGHYEIIAAIGAGGMGEVYRARDLRLGRDVAIKVLPAEFERDTERMGRFQREAKVLASLNHSNIAAIYGLEDSGSSSHALVMELVEGPTLADRIKQGPIPVDEALRMAKQICEALEYAHERGIVHRDLKPANIKVTNEDAVKVLDFGLAKAIEGDPSSIDISSSPTMSRMATMQGVLLGTAAYMSPEQAKAKPVDRRADIWAFGCVLYEMLTGKRTFHGETNTDTLAAVIRAEPDWSQLPAATPLRVRMLLQHCLQKDPKQRLQAIGDARIFIDEVLSGAPDPMLPATPVGGTQTARVVPWVLAVVLAAVALGTFFLLDRERPQPIFTNVTFREGMLQSARFSHDGQTIVYSGEWEGSAPQVAVARVGSPESRPLGIPSATVAAISSSDELAVLTGCETVFHNDCGGTLSTVSLAGGAPRALAEHVAYADWSPDGKDLLISTLSVAGARLEFPPGHVLLEQKSGWFGHPRFSPDGHLIAYENHPILGDDRGSVEVVDLSGKRRVLSAEESSLEGIAWGPDGREVWYAGTATSGWADTVYAVSLTGKQRAISTMPYLRLHDVAKDGRALISHETWRTQLIGFFPNDKAEHPFSWLDSTTPTGITANGGIISFFEGGEIFGIYQDFMAYYRSTDGSPAVFWGPGVAVISPDGRWLLVTRAKSHKLELQPVGPETPRELPTPGLVNFNAQSWSGDGRVVAYEAQTDRNEWNLYRQTVSGGPPTLVKTEGRNGHPILSSDGSMLAVHVDGAAVSLYRVDSLQPAPLKGGLPDEYPIQFTADGRALLVGQSTETETVLTLVDLASGRRQLWKRLPSSHLGSLLGVVVTPDLKYYAYILPRFASDLYLVENLR